MEYKAVLNINKKIGLKEWERFEVLADESQDLWQLFWHISDDKEKIVEKKMCAFKYFADYIMPTLETPIRKFLVDDELLKTDIETIFSLYMKLLPKTKCDECDGLDCFVQKMGKHYNQEYS